LNFWPNMSPKIQNSRCKSLAKSGKPCRAAATEGGLCFFHANPNKASELGRIGGRRKGHAAVENVDPLPVLDNAIAVRDTLARLIPDLYAGKLELGVAARLAPLLNLQLRVIETADLEQRVAKLEKLSTKLEKDRANQVDAQPITQWSAESQADAQPTSQWADESESDG